MVVACHLLEDCKTLKEWEKLKCNVIAADAWAAGAVIFFAVTGSRLVEDGPTAVNGTLEEYHTARQDHLLQVHAQWKVSQIHHLDRLTAPVQPDWLTAPVQPEFPVSAPDC